MLKSLSECLIIYIYLIESMSLAAKALNKYKQWMSGGGGMEVENGCLFQQTITWNNYFWKHAP
jgi:hypothetical protein